MPRYIEADEFVKRVIHYPRQSTKTIGLALADTPTADVHERNVGKWIEEDDGIIHGYCSNCGWESIWQETDVFGMNYCPNCGAKMDGKETEDE